MVKVDASVNVDVDQCRPVYVCFGLLVKTRAENLHCEFFGHPLDPSKVLIEKLKQENTIVVIDEKRTKPDTCQLSKREGN